MKIKGIISEVDRPLGKNSIAHCVADDHHRRQAKAANHGKITCRQRREPKVNQHNRQIAAGHRQHFRTTDFGNVMDILFEKMPVTGRSQMSGRHGTNIKRMQNTAYGQHHRRAGP